MKKYILICCLFSSSVHMCFAQREYDALKYSLTDLSGSARYVSMSGAFGALGGDMSVMGMNPAGIAVYRSSELSITPSLSSSSAKSVFNGYKSNDSKSNLLINNFGYVGSFRTYDETEISNFNFGISYNKVKDFNRNVTILGKSRSTSLLTKICADQNSNDGGTAADLVKWSLADYAYEAGLINKNTTTNKYETLLYSGEKVDNKMNLMESGGIDEWNFSLGANYGNFLYLGMSLGVQSIDYELKSAYSEASEGGLGFELRNVLSTTGTGVNFKIGAIIKPDPYLRIGLTYHTPTYFSMTDVYNASMFPSGVYYATTGEAVLPVSGVETPADYQLKTPGLFMLSGAYQFGQKGFISMDWEIVDYREIELKDADGYPYEDTNSNMYQYFRAASHLRLGGEYRLNDNISLRGGAAWYQSPMSSSFNENTTAFTTAGTTPHYEIYKDTYYLSCGAGYRSGCFFMDAALQRQMCSADFYNFYDNTITTDQPKYSKLDSNKTNLIFTFGYKF
jgi:hypothetical protein